MVDWSISETDDLNQFGYNFLNVFEQMLNVHAPLKKVKIIKQNTKQKAKPWINNDILELIKLKDKTHDKFIKENYLNNMTQLTSKGKMI